MKCSDKCATLAIGEPLSPLDPPMIIIGLPDTAWLTLKNGETADFDLRNAGIFANLIIMRAADGADVARLLGEAQSTIDGAPDVGVPEPTKQ